MHASARTAGVASCSGGGGGAAAAAPPPLPATAARPRPPARGQRRRAPPDYPHRGWRDKSTIQARATSPLPHTWTGDGPEWTAADAAHLTAAAAWALASAGEAAPHPYVGCVLADAAGRALAAGHTAAEGAAPAEAAAVAALPRGAPPAVSAYLSLEPDGRGGAAATAAATLTRAGVRRVVVGMLRPEARARGAGVGALAAAGLAVAVVPPPPPPTGAAGGGGGGGGGAITPSPPFPADPALAAALAAADGTPWPPAGLVGGGGGGRGPGTPATAADLAAAAAACLAANAPLLVRSLTGRPLGLLKYAMTLDGKIAASTGHAAWVSSPAARGRVFAGRAVSNAVVVGGNTVRRDDPRLTARRPGGGTAGHAPLRVVMSRTLDLPPDAALWETGAAPTVVATQAGARRDAQAALAARGVEVVEFDFLTPGAVADYLAARGALQVLWECGGRLAAPAIVGGAIHRVMAFVAPKIIGGDARAPTPVGDLGTVSMGQALDLAGAAWETVGPDVLCTGWLPGAAGGGPAGMDGAAARGEGVRDGARGGGGGGGGGGASSSAAAGAALPGGGLAPLLPGVTSSLARRACTPGADPGPPPALEAGGGVAAGGARASPAAAAAASLAPPPRPVRFFKSWGPAGDLSNFSAHAVTLPSDPVPPSSGAAAAPAATTTAPTTTPPVEWRTVEHFYQAQKFAGVAGPAVAALVAAITAAPSPEAAAKLGRTAQRDSPGLVRPDWEEAKPAVMACALRAKVASHPSVAAALAATGDAPIVEASPSDYYWGAGVDGQGCNALGRAWEGVRREVVAGGGSGGRRQLLLEGQAAVTPPHAGVNGTAAAGLGGGGGGVEASAVEK